MRRGFLIVAIVAGACGDDAPDYLSREEMLDPETCRDCHPKHFAEWQSSMHAYAADDPVFRAMNARGQRETNGELGDFCIKCHAPMAVRDGLTSDGLNLDDVPQTHKGVTCFFCHSVTAVEGDHNNPLVLADDLVMRGAFSDAVDNGKHATAYSRLLDRNATESSSMCGSCHDIVNPAGVHIERTFAEYKDSVFPDPGVANIEPTSCNDCHTQGKNDVVADFEGVPRRRRHEHTYPGIDTAITEWPGKDIQLAGIARDLAALLVVARLCYSPAGNQIELRLENIGAGHMFPSGAALDRRAWVEIKAWTADALTFESGVVPEGGSPTELDDPNLWLLRDRGFDADGNEAHMFWEIASIESELLPPATEFGVPHSVLHVYPLGAQPVPDRIEVKVHIQAIGRDVLDDLIDSGDLASEYRDSIPTHTVGNTFVWDLGAPGCLP